MQPLKSPKTSSGAGESKIKSKGAAIERVVPLHFDAAKSMVAGWYWIALAFAVAVAACTRNREAPLAPFVPITVLESQYGHLITAGNHPMGDQKAPVIGLAFFAIATVPFGACPS
jgi:hypothetical protein